MASLTEESLSRLIKQELITIMLKMQNKMLRRYVNLMKVFSNLDLALLQQKMLIASSKIVSLTCRGNAGQMLSIRGENV